MNVANSIEKYVFLTIPIDWTAFDTFILLRNGKDLSSIHNLWSTWNPIYVRSKLSMTILDHYLHSLFRPEFKNTLLIFLLMNLVI
jgi:hypothetical protein